MKTVYDLLGVDPDADDETVRKAFREAAKLNHPDLHPDDPDAADRFRRIAAANAILRDAKQRAAYDRLLARERRHIRSKWARIVMSGAISVSVLSVVLVIGSIRIAPRVLMFVPESPVEADAVRRPTEWAAMLPAAPADATARYGSGDGSEGIAERVIEQPAAPVTNGAEVQAFADDGPAPSLLPNEAEFYRERGLAAYRRDDFHRAIADLDQAIRRDPNDAKAYNIRGNAWDRLGDFDRALADYDEAIRIDPNNPAAFHDRGMSWRRKGDLNRALVDMDRAIRFGFSDASFYNDRGLIWYDKGRYFRAIADFDRASRIDPGFAAATINRDIALHPNLSR